MTAGLAAAPDGPAAAADLLLVDLDGVVYLGGEPIDGAAQALAEGRRRGLALRFVTNNASREPAAVAAALADFGVPAEPADVVTSAQAAAALLAAELPPGARVLVTGAPALAAAVRAAGLTPVAAASDGPAAVVNGYSPDLDYAALAEAAVAIRAGARWVATNLDRTLPSPRGLLPGNGALTALLATATDRQPASAGKPAPALLTEAARRAAATRPLVVGDRLDTDIAAAVAAGLPSLLVLTGVSGPTDLLAAPPSARPTQLGESLADLFRPHPAVEPTGPATASCGGFVATAGNGVVQVRGDGRALDGLRAAAVAAWVAADAGATVPTELAGLSWPARDRGRPSG